MTKLKLTDAERVILSSAGARESGLVLPLPKSLKKSRATLDEILRDLLGKALVGEQLTQLGEEPWTTSDNGERTSLSITAAGLVAVGMGADSEASIVENANKPSRAKGAKPASPPNRAAKTVARVTGVKAKPAEAERTGKRTTKLDLLVAALRQKKGATIPELMEGAGWQAHSVRGAISGALKKRMGLEISSKVIEGRGRVYRIEG